jgi:tRNA threonylcarbamoyladenosine biosynthesis protein TsaE
VGSGVTAAAPATVVIATHSAAETEALGERIGGCLRAGDVVALVGPLGAGKTVIARGIARGAGAAGHVASPSFVVIREYPGPVLVRHADLYRLERDADIADLGLDELTDDAVLVVEWADRAPALFPDALRVAGAFGPGPDDRTYTVVIPSALAARLADLTSL